MTLFELSLASLDCHYLEHSGVSLLAYLRFLDPEIALLHSKMMQLSEVAACAADFIRRLGDLKVRYLPQVRCL